jgi:hypothetical protein
MEEATVSEALCNFSGEKLGFTHICANVAVPNELQSIRDERDRLAIRVAALEQQVENLENVILEMGEY